ncbi:hypothetical protein VTK73DRAFT_2421 [Phialemonium thermophilum]|uniref:Uncharacterized protein n=1 Tax=Phialemonium thermophilum TaxID=223376 RepID=A0ABR3VS51_9PEZI
MAGAQKQHVRGSRNSSAWRTRLRAASSRSHKLSIVPSTLDHTPGAKVSRRDDGDGRVEKKTGVGWQQGGGASAWGRCQDAKRRQGRVPNGGPSKWGEKTRRVDWVQARKVVSRPPIMRVSSVQATMLQRISGVMLKVHVTTHVVDGWSARPTSTEWAVT